MAPNATEVLFVRLPPFVGYRRHHPREVAFPFTIAYTATMAEERGWRVSILDAWAEGLSFEACLKRLTQVSPRIAVLETSALVLPAVRLCAQHLKAQGTEAIAVFGAVPTYAPEAVLAKDSPIDAAFTGESEMTALEFFDAIRVQGPLAEVPGLASWDHARKAIVRGPDRRLMDDLDPLPIIDYSLLPMRRYYMYSLVMPYVFRSTRWGFVLASRGCPFGCAHCGQDHRKTFGKRFRKVGPERVLDEIEHLVRHHKVNAIAFEDDCFSYARDHVFALCDAIERRKLGFKWVVETRVDLLDRELVRRMRRAGCVGLNLGLESGSDRVLERLHKGYTRRQALEGLRVAGEEGMQIRLMLMFGNPGETEQDIAQTVDLVMGTPAVLVQAHLCTPYPGSDLSSDEAALDFSAPDFSPFDTITCNMSRIPDERIWTLQSDLYRRYYFSWHYLKVFFRQRLPYLIGWGPRQVPMFAQALYYLLRKRDCSEERTLGLSPEVPLERGSGARAQNTASDTDSEPTEG